MTRILLALFLLFSGLTLSIKAEQPTLSIDKVEYHSQLLLITGAGFQNQRLHVFLNGVEMTHRVTSLTDRHIVISGSRKTLGLRGGDSIEVWVAGRRHQYLTPTSIRPLNSQNIQVEVGKTVTLDLKISDESKFELQFACDRGDFVKLEGTLLRIAPQNKDLGLTTCRLKVTDQSGLSTETTFFIEVIPCGQPIFFNPVGDQVIRIGETRIIEIRTENPCGRDPITLSLSIAPSYVTMIDRGNGTASLRIAPGAGDEGGRVLINARDSVGLFGQLNFAINVKVAATINSVSYIKPSLFINGIGFGGSGARITINNQDVTARVSAQTDSSITLKGNKKRLNLKSGPNLIRVSTSGVETLEYVFEL